MQLKLSILLISPWVEVMARSPLCSMAYNKLKPQVTLCGSCFVTKSSSMPYDHFFFKSNMEWSRSSLNLDSIICSIEKRANQMNYGGEKKIKREGYSTLHCNNKVRWYRTIYMEDKKTNLQSKINFFGCKDRGQKSTAPF